MAGDAPYRLYITPTSPFARKCRIVLRERGLEDRVVEFDARIRTPENEILDVSPLGKAPTLTGPDGLTLVDSSIICEFLDRLDGPPELHGADFNARMALAPAWALSESLLESLAWLTREFRRPPSERSPTFIAHESARQRRVYDWLERNPPVSADRDVSHITYAVALDYAIYRFPEDDWRRGRPNLAAWFSAESERPGFQATALPPKI